MYQCLAAFGMPGCFARCSDDAVSFVSGSGGSASYQLAIPASLVLLGVRFHQQAVVLDPGAGNPLGAVISEAAEALIGR